MLRGRVDDAGWPDGVDAVCVCRRGYFALSKRFFEHDQLSSCAENNQGGECLGESRMSLRS